ncbi:ATP-binding protein [Nocardioides dilutus]
MDLLGREGDLRHLADALRRLDDGESSIVLVRGAAGIGKTALLAAARTLANESGAQVLHASGGELEREFPYGVVRQLFERVLWSLTEAERKTFLAGAARHSTPIVAPYVEHPDEPSDPYAVLHGLYWLTVNLAGRGPLVLTVDDAHWADPSSLRFLGHLGRRLEGLPVLLVVALRPGDSDAADDALRALEVDASVLEPAALPPEVVASLLHRTFGEDADPAFVDACHLASGGNPFLVLELARALAGAGQRPTAEAAPTTADVAPASVADAVTARLTRLPAGSAELAQAVAVLGGGARLDLAAELAGLELDAAARLSDGLYAAHVLSPGPPLAFAHPVVRSAVQAAMSPAARSAAHARAARLLTAERADPDTVATHLLACDPAGDPDLVAALRRAARHAADRGAPEAAATYLRRAREEGGPAAGDPDLLFELALAEKLARHPDAMDDLRAALRAAVLPDVQVTLACELSETLATTGQWAASLAVLDEVRTASARDPAASIRLETQFATVAAWDPTRVTEFEQRIPHLLDLLAHEPNTSGRLALTVAANLSMRGGDETQARRLLDQGLGDGRFLAEEGCEALELQLAGSVLVNSEDLEGADRFADQIVAEAHRRGSAYGFFNGTMLRARSASRAGDLIRATGDLRAAFEVADEHGLVLGLGSLLIYGGDTIAERPDLDDLAGLARGLGVPEALEGTPIGMVLHAARGRARLVAGDLAGAAEDFTAMGAVAEAVSYRNPNALVWRSPLALAIRDTEPGRARQLVEEELADAHRVDRPRAVGIALRALGVLEGGDLGLARLGEAVEVLAGSPARLEQHRALFELGSAQRRANRRSEARDTLRAALDGARRLGALRLAERAEQELLAAGARPRRAGLSGVDALTPSERRVAQMAASGLSNPAIAQALFVSLNTVETHLRHAFRKLEITRRTQLRSHLDA